MKVLVVDDDPKYRAFVTRGLTESGLECASAGDGESALDLLKRDDFDVVLLDVMLPRLQGWDVFESMTANGISVPVIFVTACDSVDERVKGLTMGGDDYVVKPFAFDELLARIRVALRHRGRETGILVGDLEIDLRRQEARRQKKLIPLTRTEFSVLRRLAEAGGAPVSKEALLADVWGVEGSSDTNVVEMHVSRLRRKIDGPFEEKLIHTVRGEGYALEDRG